MSIMSTMSCQTVSNHVIKILILELRIVIIIYWYVMEEGPSGDSGHFGKWTSEYKTGWKHSTDLKQPLVAMSA